MARELSIKASDLGLNPILNSRDPELPVGLKVGYLSLVRDFLHLCCAEPWSNLLRKRFPPSMYS